MKNNQILRDKVELFLDGKLNDSEKDELWAELLGSPEELEYMQTVATLKKMKRDSQLETADHLPTVVHPIQGVEKSNQAVSGFRKYLIAASLLVIGLAVLFRVSTMIDLPGEFEPLSMIEFEIERSGEDPNKFDRDLQYAISHSVSGDLESSLERLNNIDTDALSEEEMFDLVTVRGSIYFNMKLYEEAAEIFTEISEMDRLRPLEREKSLWYLANAQVQLNQYEKAIENIEEVINLDGAFSRPAKKLQAYILSKESSEIVQEQ